MITTTSPVRENLHVHLPRLKKYARYLTRMTSGEPDDLVQETCVIALAHERQYTRGSLGKWLCRIMEHVYANSARRFARRSAMYDRPTHPCARRAVAPPIETVQPPLQERGRLLLDDLVRAIKKIPVERQQTVALLADEDLSWADISKIVRASPAAVRDRIYKGRKRLRELMA
jgi:RNA polymerase sigma-70 factor (ECF subfamily)